MASSLSLVAGTAGKAAFNLFRKLPGAVMPSSGLCACGSLPPPGGLAGLWKGSPGAGFARGGTRTGGRPCCLCRTSGW